MPHDVRFVPSGRGKAQCAPDPTYPNGLDIVIKERPACTVNLPYPAAECGHWEITCTKCGLTVAVTAAGRPDDPKSVQLPCIATVN